MKYLFVLTLIAVFIGCKSLSKNETPPSATIYFGSYGGFSNDGYEHSLSKDGTISKINYPEKDIISTINIDKKLCQQIFKSYEQLGLNQLELLEPGNRTNFITMQADGKEHIIKWPLGKMDIPENLKSFFKLLNQFPNNKNY